MTSLTSYQNHQAVTDVVPVRHNLTLAICSDIILYAKAMHPTPIMNLIDAVELKLGFEPIVDHPRFDLDGWYFQSDSPVECEKCGTSYKIFRCPYQTSKGKYRYWAVVCDGCATVFALDGIPVAKKKDLKKWDDEIGSQVRRQLQLAPAISTYPKNANPLKFATEEYLEDFLIANWDQTEFGQEYDILGRQYPTDSGQIDILAISKDNRRILVVELKKGRASDSVVAQIQRYLGYVTEVLAEQHQEVHGVIIALEDDFLIQRTLKVARNIAFYKYVCNFRLELLSFELMRLE